MYSRQIDEGNAERERKRALSKINGCLKVERTRHTRTPSTNYGYWRDQDPKVDYRLQLANIDSSISNLTPLSDLSFN